MSELPGTAFISAPEPAVSVIVPVYKTEAWLPQCVESLLAQTLREIEIILVDDGSPDRCGALCDAYAARDTRVRVIHQENRGLSAARNAGTACARGQYLMYVDSDDWVEPDYCGVPYRLAQTERADLVLFCNWRGPSGTEEVWPKFTGEGGKLTAKAFIEQYLFRLGGTPVWNKLYRRELLDGLPFEEGVVYEDHAFTHKAVLRAEKICYIRRPLYHYRVRPGSICRSRMRKAEEDRFVLSVRRCEELAAAGIDRKLLQEEGGRKAMAYVKRARPVREDPLAGMAEELLLAAKDSFRKKPLKTRILYGLYRHARPLFYLTTAVFGKQSVQ